MCSTINQIKAAKLSPSRANSWCNNQTISNRERAINCWLRRWVNLSFRALFDPAPIICHRSAQSGQKRVVLCKRVAQFVCAQSIARVSAGHVCKPAAAKDIAHCTKGIPHPMQRLARGSNPPRHTPNVPRLGANEWSGATRTPLSRSWINTVYRVLFHKLWPKQTLLFGERRTHARVSNYSRQRERGRSSRRDSAVEGRADKQMPACAYTIYRMCLPREMPRCQGIICSNLGACLSLFYFHFYFFAENYLVQVAQTIFHFSLFQIWALSNFYHFQILLTSASTDTKSRVTISTSE